MSNFRRAAGFGAIASVAGAGAYLGLVTGAAPLDLGVGRRLRPLGPQTVRIAAPREIVFDVVAGPYAERTTRAMRDKVEVLERGSDLVLAAHYTPIGKRMRATTVETVRFTRPRRVDFRLVRGPVPHVEESFELAEEDGGTALRYGGTMGTDLWGLGQWWGRLVARRWEDTVAASLESVQVEAERRATRTQ